MKFEEKAKKNDAQTDGEQPEVPEDFICIDPPQKPLVFDFLTNFNQDIREVALVHLKLCLHCREIAATVLELNRYREPKSGHYLHAEEIDITVEAEQVS